MRPTSSTKISKRVKDARGVATPGKDARKVSAGNAKPRASIAFMPGEPAGIGPDLAAMLANEARDYNLTFIADPKLLTERAVMLGLRGDFPLWPARNDHGVSVLAIETAAAVLPGKLDPRNAPYVLETLRRAIRGCSDGDFDALVTGPVHKGVINDAGIAFTGHTEFLAQETHTPQVVMMLTANDLRVALATTHLPLAEVSRAITATQLRTTLEILHRDLQEKFNIADPLIIVLGLNPHAGESGHLGREEIEVIAPVVNALAARGMRLRGPLPADTAFTPERLKGVDAVLAMYHDQGLPVLKYVGFGHAVNITLGLPIVRTSVDHGTALDLAGSGRIDRGSADAAIALALSIVRAGTAA